MQIDHKRLATLLQNAIDVIRSETQFIDEKKFHEYLKEELGVSSAELAEIQKTEF